MQPGITVRQLTKDFGGLRAVDDLSFSVGSGEVVGFLGPNGAGKSTTMKMITGYLEPTSGEVEVCGMALSQQPLAIKAAIGYLPEGAPLYGDMTPRRFLDFIASVRGLEPAERHRRIDAVVDRMALRGVLDQAIDTLSKGFKRRVGLAQAILHDPPVLILDEPTDGLDPNQKHEVRELIRDIAADKAIIISTHILEEVEAICSRAVIIAGGRLLADGRPAELASRSEYHNAVVLVVRDGPPDLRERLAAVPGVARVEVLDEAGDRLRLLASHGRSILAAVGDALSGAGLQAEELYVEAGRLDDVFRNLTHAVAGRETRS
ncbi:MAG TPA: ABC transporter ATP-binding protein [Gammaproteobacteria bacterium]|uniref:ABC transporter ATP-binding protein n=2 Tax=Immundisolibacter sp. TaxID=1934948 RepID=UPI000E9BFF34|nr:ABC transporter ATP-binding protein [Gammaproteobacteria bacterium]HCZ49771.1 ABC transporter ATP-binding protein [Gammaproteobacteria bacterium]MCH79209.1 ABC transporter ATP-binding protein [Gammaproteobacteria bacterium]